tara:strand:+ start:128 stop:472 length:345 start_codon:yes stop_codon:yes gene_type:complete
MINNWVEKIRTNDPAQVAELYHNDGLLLGTFSNIERHGNKLILDYFNNLLKSQIDVKIITNHEYKTDSLITNSGLYNFIVDSRNIKARFTFVFVKTENDWKIISHHSSILPEKN